MKLRKDELSSSVLVSMKSIYTSMAAFNIVLSTGLATSDVLQSMDDNISHYIKTVNFANEVMNELDENIRETIKENIELIYSITEENIELISELYPND